MTSGSRHNSPDLRLTAQQSCQGLRPGTDTRGSPKLPKDDALQVQGNVSSCMINGRCSSYQLKVAFEIENLSFWLRLVPICGGGPPKQCSNNRQASEALLVKQMWLHIAQVRNFQHSRGLQLPASIKQAEQVRHAVRLCACVSHFTYAACSRAKAKSSVTRTIKLGRPRNLCKTSSSDQTNSPAA